MATFTGKTSNDTITPTSVSSGVTVVPAGRKPSTAPDAIDGVDGTDTIDGGGGADTIFFSGAGSTARGGYGADTVRFHVPERSSPVLGTAEGGGDNDVVNFSVTGEDRTYGGKIYLRGGDGSDTMSGDAAFSSFRDVDVYMYGEGGNDRLEATVQLTGSSYVPYEGAKNDDFLYGGTGNNTYFVQEQQDVVIENSGQGYDTVEVNNSSTGSYTLAPNVEKLMVWDWYLHWSCSLTGNASANQIIGTWRNDTLNGAGGNDTIYGKPISEGYAGEDDHDTIRGGSGDDRIYGGGGDADTWDGNDKLYGDDGNDRIFGHNGNDTMYGGSGDDEMGGQAGNDTMSGDAGIDKLGGGGGNDTFDYDYAADSKPGASYRDVITDFGGIGASAVDRIDLSTLDANTGLAGNQLFKFMGTQPFDGAGQLRLASSGADTVIQANTGGSLATPEMEIAVTDGGAPPAQWSATDFIL